MIRFECDYGEGAAQPVLDLLQKTNLEQTPGYGMDDYCDQARGLIRKLCDCNLVRRTEKGRLRRRGWGLRWEKAQKGGKGTNLRGFFED